MASSFSVSVSLTEVCSVRRASAIRRETARLIASAFSRLVPLSTLNQSRQAPASGSQTRFTVPVSARGVTVTKIWLCCVPNHSFRRCNSGTVVPYGWTRRTLARICRLSRALSTLSTLGSSRMAASTISNAWLADMGISICRRCRLASVPAFALPLMRRTRRRCDDAAVSTKIIATHQTRNTCGWMRHLRLDTNARTTKSTTIQGNSTRM